MMDNDDASRFRELLAAERRSADLYHGLAEAAHGERREILNQLAAVERRHAEHWAAKLVDLGEPVPEPGSRDSRTRVVSWLARRFSVDAVLPFLERAERADAGMYQDDPEATSDMLFRNVRTPGCWRNCAAALMIGMCCAAANHGIAATDPAPFAPACSASTTGSCRTHRW
jgi:hypothetical protein